MARGQGSGSAAAVAGATAVEAAAAMAAVGGPAAARAAAAAAMVGKVTAATTVGEVKRDPRTGDWGRMLFPITFDVPGDDVPLSAVGGYLPWYNYVDPAATVDIVDDVLARAGAGERVFLPVYSESEMREADGNPVGFRLRDVGLFSFPAKGLAPGEKAPFAIVSAGGGFCYVGSMQDSFPHCLWLSRHGVTAFAMQYRPEANLACEDLARAISHVFAHAGELRVDTRGYSLWGGSAGGRMAAYLGTYGPAAFGGDDLPRPAAVVVNYTGHSLCRPTDPATFSAVGERDFIASWTRMRDRLCTLSKMGVPTEFHHYPGLPHGFGLGTGTVAEGWINQALAFWKANRGGVS